MDFATMRQLDSVTLREARQIGKQFARWLNATGGTRLVLQLLDLEQQIRHSAQQYLDYLFSLPEDGPESDDTADEMGKHLDKMRSQFNDLISRFKIFPRLIDTESFEEWGFRWELVHAPRKELNPRAHRESKWTTDDLDALFAIVRLAQSAYLSRMKQRHCGDWFFERTYTQEFCTAKCRQWAFSKTDEFRAHRREYMRRYYKLQRSGNVK
jgi:hypothetical protein